MKRRLLLAATAASIATALAAASTGATAQPRYQVSAQRLQQAVAERFPLHLSVGGLLRLTVETPLLRFLPELNRMAADMVVVASGPALALPSAGAFDLDFALRYERSDRTIRAHRLRVGSLRVSGLPAPYPELLDAVRQTLAQRTFGEVVLHRLTAKDLALADVMGLEPDTISVVDDGLVIGFAAR